MENKLTNEEIAKVFAMYLGCEFLAERWSGKVFKEMAVRNVSDYNIVIYSSELKRNGVDGTGNSPYAAMCSEIKLLLKPLSSITDEYAIEVAELINNEKYKEGEEFKVVKEDAKISIYSSKIIHTSIPDYGYRYETKIYIEDCFVSPINPYSALVEMGYYAYQYLISKGYALPLFFAPTHWANGKTAIELGIAIESTK